MTSDLDWVYFAFGLIAYQILKFLARSINQIIIERRQRKFLKLVKIEFPDRSKITFIAIDASDKRAMAKLERQLREEHDLLEGDDEDRDGDSGLAGGLRLTPPYRRKDSPR